MSIIYPIVQGGGGGGGGDATSLRGVNINTNTPQEGNVLYFDGSDWKPNTLQTFIPFYAAPTYFTGTDQQEVTKLSFANLLPGTGQVYLKFTATVNDPHTGSLSLSGSEEGFVFQNQHITSSDFSTLVQANLSASSQYTLFASSSNASSQFKIYHLLAAI
jgi:hypothetical protein